jgi:hypothetical protein
MSKINIKKESSFVDQFNMDFEPTVVNRKSSSNEYLIFSIELDDDLLVQKIKTVLNQSKISMQDIYNHFGAAVGYNLVYALKHRHQMYIKTALLWCEFLNKDLVISLI